MHLSIIYMRLAGPAVVPVTVCTIGGFSSTSPLGGRGAGDTVFSSILAQYGHTDSILPLIVSQSFSSRLGEFYLV